MSDIKVLIQKLDALADELLAAPHFRARVHMAEHVYDAIGDIMESLENVVKNTKDDVTEASGVPEISMDHLDEPRATSPLRFRKLTLVRIARILLKEQGQLHGREIERLAKEGGYKSAAEHFQSMLSVALKRDGGFENVGGNQWRLKPASMEQGVPQVVQTSLNGVMHDA
jgi:hypothetical protein